MAQHLKRIFSLILTVVTFSAYGQTECDSISDPKLPRIFGGHPYSSLGIDSVITKQGYTIAYSCWNCNIKGIRPNGKVKWEFDLSEFGCQLSQFIALELEDEHKYSEYDFAFSFDEMPTFMMNSKTGRYTIFVLTEEK